MNSLSTRTLREDLQKDLKLRIIIIVVKSQPLLNRYHQKYIKYKITPKRYYKKIQAEIKHP